MFSLMYQIYASRIIHVTIYYCAKKMRKDLQKAIWLCQQGLYFSNSKKKVKMIKVTHLRITFLITYIKILKI